MYGKMAAVTRALGARQFTVPFIGYYSPPLSAIVIVLGMIVFFCGKSLCSLHTMDVVERMILVPTYSA